MLQMIRDQVKGWLAVVIFTIMIIPFAFWGINYYFDQSGEIVAIEVNGEEITLADFQRAYQDMRRQWQSTSGEPVREETEPLLKQRVTEDLVQNELLKQAGKKAGLYVSDREAWDTIRQVSVFNDDNGFNMMMFERAANQGGLTPAGFLARIKQDMAVEQLRSALFATDFVTQSELSGYSAIRHQTRDLLYALLSADEFKDTVEVTDESVQSYYGKEGRFMQPEKVRIAYLVLSLAKVAEEVYLEDGELEAWFDGNRENYEIEETRKVKQILVKLPEEPSEEIQDEMKAKAEELYELVAGQGESWEEVVVNHSGEHEDSVEFSEFGFLARGVLEAEVEEVVFSMQAGEVGEPVQSSLGFHIVGVDEIQGGTTADLASIRHEVEQDLRRDKAARQLYELVDRLSSLTYENPDTLEVAAEELGLDIQTSDYLSREDPGTGIVSEPGILSAAFSDEVLLEEHNSELIELDDDRHIVLRVQEHLPGFKTPLDAVRDTIVTRLKFEQAKDLARERGETILEQLQQGKSREDLEYSLDWQNASDVTRDNEDIHRAVLRTAFQAGVSGAGGAVYEGVSLGTGDYALVIVRSVAEADPDAMGEEELDAARGQLLQAHTSSTWAEFNENLHAGADITVYEESLQ